MAAPPETERMVVRIARTLTAPPFHTFRER